MDLEEQHQRVLAAISHPDYADQARNWLVSNGHWTTYGEEVGDDGAWTSCGLIVLYLTFLWGYGGGNSDIPPTIYTWKQLSQQEGVFSVYLDQMCDECHYFVVWLTATEIHIYQGYGGVVPASHICRDKVEWCEALASLASEGAAEENFYEVYKLFEVTPYMPFCGYFGLDATVEARRLFLGSVNEICGTTYPICR